MSKKICAIGCSPSKYLFMFPCQEKDNTRRKLWLNFFDIEEPHTKYIYACERHFSQYQYNSTTKGIKKDAVPDVPAVCNAANLPFRRKTRNLRSNVIVVTPRDPEYIIYRNKTGIFQQNLFSFSKPILPFPTISLPQKPLIQMPIVKSVSCSMVTQTNTRMCGFVQISDFLDEFRLNCFYCCETFLLQDWSKFVKHLKIKHFEQEESFKMSNCLTQDHDYTPVGSPSRTPIIQGIKSNTSIVEPFNIMPTLPVLNLTPAAKTQLISLPILAPPPPLQPKPTNTNSDDHNSKPFSMTLASKLINLLDETVLNPNFRSTDEDNIVVIKKNVVEHLQSNFLSKNITNDTEPIAESNIDNGESLSKNSQMSSSKLSSKLTRPVYTLDGGQQNIVSVRNVPRVVFKRVVKKRIPNVSKSESESESKSVSEVQPTTSHSSQPILNKKKKLAAKRIVQQALENITTFENIYQTVKTRPPKVLSSGVFYIKDINSNKVTEMMNSNKTPLSRCLRKGIADLDSIINTATTKRFQLKPTELVFEYTPRDVINSLLDNMKLYPVLWEFHYSPFNSKYSAAIEELCQTINTKWSLNLNPLKMRSSINRILKFYRYMLPCENIDKFLDYFDKCAMFLPSTVEGIPRARCIHCYICYQKDSELRKHLIEKHQFLKWPYKCENCPERFMDRDDYELHKRLPHYVEIFKCQQCDKRFNRSVPYRKHMSSHEKALQRQLGVTVKKSNTNEDIKHVCTVCSKEFNKASDLRKHEIYHQDKRFKCHVCPKAFFMKPYLNAHLKTHSDQRNFICELCGKGFIRYARLILHRKTHSGEKVTCSICNLKLSETSLPRHMRLVHVAVEGTLQQTFRAQSYHYNKIYKNRHNQKLSRAKETKSRKYDCKICKIPFDKLKFLKDHNAKVHNDVKRSVCKICNFAFRHIQNLKFHYRKKHKLHFYQADVLVDEDADLNTVLAMTAQELEELTTVKVKNSNSTSNVNYFEQDKIHGDTLQDEIMKAVENIDREEIKVDDVHSLNDFFSDLLKNPLQNI
ncbi:hypothetical protein DOY81_001987 [Sarcophaga bullata]|nr:hypothetical protein DOY81_001987 [Sarcophaga bullata]